jgi:hypothetical protein
MEWKEISILGLKAINIFFSLENKISTITKKKIWLMQSFSPQMF